MITALIIAAVVLIAAAAGLYAAYRKAFYTNFKDTDDETDPPTGVGRHPFVNEAKAKTLELAAMDCETVAVRSYDGLRLSGRVYKGKEDMPVCLCFHGYRGSAVRDYSCGGLLLIKQGYTVILPDHRGHWHSEGHTITFGIKERYDVLTWLGYVNERFGADRPVFIFGISMGAGTVLMASGQKLPDNVRGIVADCPFSSPMDIILHVCRKLGMIPSLCRPIVWLSARVFGRFNVCETTAADEVKKATKPIMIIHGEGDDFVPMYMSEQVRDSRPDLVEYHSFPEAGHGLSYLYDPQRYESLVNAFMKKHLP